MRNSKTTRGVGTNPRAIQKWRSLGICEAMSETQVTNTHGMPK